MSKLWDRIHVPYEDRVHVPYERRCFLQDESLTSKEHCLGSRAMLVSEQVLDGFLPTMFNRLKDYSVPFVFVVSSLTQRGCGFLEVQGSYPPLCCNTLHPCSFCSGMVSTTNVVGKDVFARNAGGTGNVGAKLSQPRIQETHQSAQV